MPPPDMYTPPAVVRPADQEHVPWRAIGGAVWRACQDSYGPLLGVAGDAAERLFAGAKSELGALAAPLTETERRAAETAARLLAADKLGGKDGRFNHDDLAQVVEALMRDKEGLRATVVAELERQGKKSEAAIVDRALCGASGITATIARGRVAREAPKNIHAELERGLASGGVRSREAQPDGTARDLTFAELREFEAALETLRGRGERLRALGLRVTFPDGPSQEAMRALLDGKLGLPPGARLERIPADRP